MKLYHGTTEAIARRALKCGLKPRGTTKQGGNWEMESQPDCVYLTETYAPYFAFSATNDAAETWGIVEVDIGLLDEDNMRPDEDYLEQVTRGHGPAPAASMEERTLWYRERLDEFAHHWTGSVASLGNAAHMGLIHKKAITRIALYEPRSNPYITMTAVDPQISLANFAFMSDKYRTLTRWFFGDDVSPEHLDASFLWEPTADDIGGHTHLLITESRRAVTTAIAQRDGLTIIKQQSVRRQRARSKR